MLYNETVNDWLGELSATIGVELKLDKNGICAMQYGKELECIIELPEKSPTVYMYSPFAILTNITESEQVVLYKKLLELNYFCLETKGATFAINDRDKQVILCYGHPIASLEYSGFKNLLGNFIEAAAQWHTELNDFLLEETTMPETDKEEKQNLVSENKRFWV